ncbi:UNVERIFIED_ORG: hypothetical protein J2Y78_004151 [Buttiauxella agrestis ATCC 33320]
MSDRHLKKALTITYQRMTMSDNSNDNKEIQKVSHGDMAGCYQYASLRGDQPGKDSHYNQISLIGAPFRIL